MGFVLAPLGACGDDATTGDATSAPDGSGNDATGSDTVGGGGATACEFAFALTNPAGKDFGEGCTTDAECMYNVCVLPDAPGNITNAQFGFCSRGCDCNDDSNSQIPAELKEQFDCLYPSGFPKRHHIVVECGSVAACQALDPAWTSCETPNTGGARKVCHAL